MNWLTAAPIAHRGWHGGGRVENSLGAARAAIEAGFTIECDIQLSADGEAVIFHDATLDRLTGAQGRVADYTASRLTALPLGGSSDTIPTLSQLLALIAGRVPLVCEIKSGFDGDTRPAARAAEIVADYAGPLAFKSFDPDVIGFLRSEKCPRPLGVVAEASYDDPYFAAMSAQSKRACEAFLYVERTRLDFLSWRVDDLPHAGPTLCRALAGLPVMTWTVRTPAQWALAREFADQAVFEGEL